MYFSHTSILSSVLFLASTLSAQSTTWIVDRNAGPGHDFTALAPAIAVAVAGDTIVVRSGSYSENPLVVDQGIRIVGEGSVRLTTGGLATPGLTIENIPAGQSFSLRNIDFSTFLSTSIDVVNCAGAVHIEDATGVLSAVLVPEPFGIRCTDCDQVDIRSVFTSGSSILFLRSRGSIRSSALEGEVAGPLAVEESDVTLDRCTVTSGFSPFVFGPVVRVTDGRLRVSRTDIQVNTVTVPRSAIDTFGNSEVLLDPTAILLPNVGQPDVSGPATIVHVELATLDVTATTTDATFDLHGFVGASFATLISAPGAAVPLPFGNDFWIDIDTHFVAETGTFGSRTQSTTFPTDGVPVGFSVVVQSAVVGADIRLTNGTVLLFP